MKRKSLFNRIISLSIIAALYLTMSASAFAELEEIPVADESVEVTDEAADLAEPDSESDQQLPNPDEETVLTDEESEEGAEILEGDEVKEPSDEDDMEESEGEEELEETDPEEETCEHKLIYTSNKDGTHTVKCEECDMEEYTETCEYDEEGTCIYCGYERLPDPVLVYEDEEVIVTVSGAVPENADLKVIPVKEGVEETKEAFEEVIKKLDEKSEESKKDVIGFLAYDISFIDIETGEEKEPDGDVTVSMSYKEAVNPVNDEVLAEARKIDVELMHIDSTTSKLENLSTSGDANIALNSGVSVMEAVFTNDSFSTYIITWSAGNTTRKITVDFKYVGSDGEELATQPTITPASATVDQNNLTATDIKTLAGKEIAGYKYVKAVYVNNNSEVEVKTWKPKRSGSTYQGYSYSLDFFNGGNTSVANVPFSTSSSAAKVVVKLYYREDVLLKVKKVATGSASTDNDAEYIFKLTDKNGAAIGDAAYKIGNTQLTTNTNGEFTLHTGETASFLTVTAGEYVISETGIRKSPDTYEFKDYPTLFTTQIFDGEEKVETYDYDYNEDRTVEIQVTNDATKEIKFKNCETTLFESDYKKATASKFVEDIRKNGQSQDKYSLTIKFKGPYKEVTPRINEEEDVIQVDKLNVDIIILIDKSHSMTETHGSKTRIQLVKEAVDNMIDKMAEKEDVDAKWEVIDFATRAAVRGGGWQTTSTVKQYVTTDINESNNEDIGRGTNYQAGMNLAQQEFTNKPAEADRPGAKKIVLFLTDGHPTYYGNGVGNNVYGSGSYLTTETENASYTAAANLQCDYFYAIGIGLGSLRYYTYQSSFWGGSYVATNKYIEGEKLLNNLKNSNPAPEDHKAAYNIDITDVSNTLEGLAGVISTIHTGATVPGEPVKSYANKVVMVDKLSDNVQFTKNSIFYINVSLNGQSLTNDASYWTDGTINENGVMGNKATYTIPDGSGVTLEATIEGKTVTLIFPQDYYLDKGYEYSVKFKIEPTDSAYEYYFNNQTYPDVGDDLTDHYNNDTGEERPEDEGEEISSNQISSLKPGFYTNDSSENGKYARTTFTFLGVDGEEELFPKPVVPVHFKNAWEIYKTDENGEAGQRLSNAAFEMIKVDTNATYTTGSSTNQEGQEGLIIWNKDEIEPNAEYVIKETATPLGYINTGEYWKIALDEENVPTITPYDADGTAHETIVVQPQLKNRNEVTYTFYYKNFKKGEAYVLPQTGGRGIYVTTVGGIMMMLTSVFLFYRNRKKVRVHR